MVDSTQVKEVEISSYVQHILSSAGSGMKSLLVDNDTMSTISVACPQSKLMAQGVYLFEKLNERNPSKVPLTFVSCICILSPLPENIDRLKHELQNPRFGQYHVFFTQHLVRSMMKELAEADRNESVKTICEMPLDFCALDKHIFATKQSSTMAECDGLLSLMTSCNYYPSICYMKASKKARGLAEMVQEKVRQITVEEGFRSGNKRAVLLICDRRLDAVTPLLTQWTYQAMIHEIFGIHNNIVDLKGFDIAKDLEKIVLSSQVDEFFSLNMYKDFGEIGEVIRKLIADFQTQKENHQNLENISDIKQFISNYPEFKKMSGTVNKHVNLVSEISKIVTNHNLLQVSEFEQNLCGNQLTSSDDAAFRNLLMASNVRKLEKLKLLCLYFLHKRQNSSQIRQFADIVAKETGTPRTSLDRLLKNLSNYAYNSVAGNLFEVKTAAATTTKFFKGLRGVENVYTQHQPVAQSLLEDLLRKRSSTDLQYLADFSFSSNVIIYFLDGFTYEETKCVRDMNSQFGSNVLIGGNKVWRSSEFLDYLQNLQ